jgi:hypothetical protein
MYKISNVISAEKAESSERNAVNKSSALTMNRFPSRCALNSRGFFLHIKVSEVSLLLLPAKPTAVPSAI